MFNPLNYLRFMFSFLTQSIENRLPDVPARRAISTTLVVVIIVVAIAVGGIAVYLVVTAPPSTTTYP